MAVKTVQYFKDKFKTGYVITEQDYADWLDSFRSSLVGVPLSDTTGLEAILAAYRKTADKIPFADIDGLTAFVNNLTANFLTTASEIAQSQVTGLVDALANFATAEQVQDLIAAGLQDVTPSVGANGNWWVNGSDTGVKAAGPDGQNGATPTINDAGNWDIGGTDTGVRANTVMRVAYDNEISGNRGEQNSLYQPPTPYVQGTMRVYIAGGIMQKGPGSDWQEVDENNVKISRIITDKTPLVFEYLEKK